MTVNLDAVKEEVSNYNPDAIFWDGYEDAIIGIAERCGKPALIVYDRDKCIQINVDRDGMSYEEAVEWFDFNVAGAWVGEGTPLILSKLESIDG